MIMNSFGAYPRIYYYLISLHVHTCQHLEIRNQDIFTILAKQVPKARAASVQAFSRGVQGHALPENF